MKKILQTSRKASAERPKDKNRWKLLVSNYVQRFRKTTDSNFYAQ